MTASLRLQQQLCFALYTASRAMNHTYLSLLDPLGLSYTQYLVLLVLWEEEGITVGRLGEHLSLDSGTLSPVLKRMGAAGLVTRQRDLSDERVVHIGLTEQGHALKDLASDIPQAMVYNSGLTVEQIEVLQHTLQQLTQNLNQLSK